MDPDSKAALQEPVPTRARTDEKERLRRIRELLAYRPLARALRAYVKSGSTQGGEVLQQALTSLCRLTGINLETLAIYHCFISDNIVVEASPKGVNFVVKAEEPFAQVAYLGAVLAAIRVKISLQYRLRMRNCHREAPYRAVP